MAEMSLLVLVPQNRKKKTKKEVAQIWMSEEGKALQYIPPGFSQNGHAGCF